MEDMELDMVTLVDDGGNEIDMVVLDYLFYEGKEYAILTEIHEEEPEEIDGPIGVLAMEVRAIEGDEEMEEFVPISDELGERIVTLFQTQSVADDDFDDEDEDEE